MMMALLGSFRKSLATVYKLQSLLVVLCVLSGALSSPVFAGHMQSYGNANGAIDELQDGDDVPEITLPGVQAVNVTHSYLSATVERFSQRIDTFFGEDRVYEESTGTYIQVRNSVIVNDDGELDYDVKFRAKLRLPQLKSRYRLVIESEGERSAQSDFNQDSANGSLLDQFESSDVSASLQYLFRETDRWNISLRPGVRFADPLEVYTKLRLSRNQALSERWLSRGTVQIGYYTEDSWVSDLRLDLERKTGQRDLFRSSTSATWREDSPGNHFLAQSCSFTHVLNPRSSVLLELGMTGETRPTLHNTAYFGNLRYRRDIHRGWLFMEVRPRVVFARENNYDEDLSLVLSLEILLGEQYSQ